MAARGGAGGSPTIGSGRRGYYRYLYGDHFWIPATEANWVHGIIRDTARVGIPEGGLYDAADVFLHQPGVAIKRGGTSYSGPVMAATDVAPYRGDALGFLPGLYLEFEDAVGSGTVADSSGNSNTGTVHGTATLASPGLVPGGSGDSISLDGTSAYVTVADATTLNPSTSMSFATWFNWQLNTLSLPVGTTNYTLLQKGSLVIGIQMVATSTHGVVHPTAITLTYSVKDSGSHTISSTALALTSGSVVGLINSTNLLVVTDDGTTIKVYMNGSLTDSKARTALNASATTGFSGISSNTMYVGAAFALSSTNYFKGVLDEYALYKDVTLSAANVTTLWGARTAVGAASTGVAVAYAEFPAGSQLVSLGDNGELYQISSGTTTPLNGQTVTGGCVDKPKIRIGGTQHLLVVPCGDGTSVPVVYDGSAAPVNLAGSPPAMKYIEIFKSRLVGAGDSSQPQRIYFSPALDITSTWDTSESWIDASHPVTGFAALHNVLLIFSLGHCEAITGSTPPPQSDMDLNPLWDIGCSDARSISTYSGNCIFANQQGVWLTNGAAPSCLTLRGGVDSLWRDLMADYDHSTWSITSVVVGNHLIVTVIDASSNVTTLACYMPTYGWTRLTNMDAIMYAASVGTQDEAYYADAFVPRVVQMSGMFSPSADNKNDANGLPVQMLLETRPVGYSPELKALGNGHVAYDMRDAATDDPTLHVLFSRGSEATTWIECSESPLPETTDRSRRRFSTGGDSEAVSIRLQQSGPSSKTEVYTLEIETRSYPLAAEG